MTIIDTGDICIEGHRLDPVLFGCAEHGIVHILQFLSHIAGAPGLFRRRHLAWIAIIIYSIFYRLNKLCFAL